MLCCCVEGHQKDPTAPRVLLSVRVELVSASVRSFGADENGCEPGMRAREKTNKNTCNSVDLHLATESLRFRDPNHSQSSTPVTFSASQEKLAASRWRVGGSKLWDLFWACWVIPAGMDGGVHPSFAQNSPFYFNRESCFPGPGM